MFRKRGQNEGSIYKRRDGRWEAMLNLGWKDGRRLRRRFYGATRAAVQEQLIAALRERDQGLLVAVERQTTGQFLDHWLEHSLKPNARPRSYESFETLIRLHIKPRIGAVALRKLGPQHIQTLLDEKLRSGLAPQTVVNIRTVLRSALNRAVKFNLVARNCAALVDPPQIPRHKVSPLGPGEAKALLEAARDERLEALYKIALTLGLRRGEILGLRWSDIDFDSYHLTVSQAVQRVNGKLQATEVKTDRSRRRLAMPMQVAAALRSRRVRQKEERLLAGRWRESGLIFTNTTGGPLEPQMLFRDFRRILAKTGLPRIRFHDLRHSVASLLLADGAHPRAVMELLGHSSISMTMNTYSHVMAPMMRDLADRMDAALG